jgi:hypothetical protein
VDSWSCFGSPRHDHRNHRERVQDQALEIYSGESYTQSVDGTGYTATATLDLTLDRVWFVLDSHARLWRPAALPVTTASFRDRIGGLQVEDHHRHGHVYPPAASAAQYRHDPRRAAGASRQIAYNEIPLFGESRSTISSSAAEPGPAKRRSH